MTTLVPMPMTFTSLPWRGVGGRGTELGQHLQAQGPPSHPLGCPCPAYLLGQPGQLLLINVVADSNGDGLQPGHPEPVTGAAPQTFLTRPAPSQPSRAVSPPPDNLPSATLALAFVPMGPWASPPQLPC